MDNYTDVLKVLREPNKGPRKHLWRRRSFWTAMFAVLILIGLSLCFPTCRAFVLLALGDVCLASEDKKDALQLYSWAFASQQDNLVAMDKYGNLLVTLGRESEAVPIFERGLKSEKGEPTAVGQLVQVHLKLKNYHDALENAEKWIAAAPNNSLAYRCRGRAFEGLNKLDRAFADYDRSTELDPHSESTTDKEQLLEKTRLMHHNFEALTEPTYENNPQDYYAVVRDGVRQFLALDQLESLDTLGRAIKMRPNDPLAYYLRARFETEVHRFAQSRADFLAVGRLWKGNQPFHIPAAPKGSQVPHPGLPLDRPHFYNELGKVCLEMRDYKNALAAFNKSDSIKSDSPMTLYYRSLTYKALGQLERADLDMQRRKKMGRLHPEVYEGGGALLLQGSNN